MATPNVGILTTAGKALIDKVNSGQAKISFSKVVFSSMDNSQLSDIQVKALTAISPQEVVVSPPETTLDTTSGETRIRATGTNKQLADGVYVKTYGVFAKDDTGNEVLYGVTVSPNPNYFPAYDGVTPQAVTYSYKTVIQEASNITMTNSNDVYVTQEDLTEAIGKIPQPDLSNYATQQQLGTRVQDNKDGTITANGTSYNMGNSGLAPLSYVASGSFNDLPLGVCFVNASVVADGPESKHGFTTETIYSAQWNGRKVQIAIEDVENTMFFRIENVSAWTDWVSLATTDDLTTAISTATANMADTTKPTNFTAGLQSGGVDVATAADLKSIEASAWRPLTLENANNGAILFKDNGDGTASLTGSANFVIAADSGVITEAIYPPSGYQFSSLAWNKGVNGNGIYAIGGRSGTSGGSIYTPSAFIDNGKICFKGGSYSYPELMFSPCLNTTDKTSSSCEPAIVGITKV